MATTTPNFSWSVPTSTDYVKDGATAIETLGDAIDGRFGDVTNYPNQIVNRVSGVSRPLPYATATGSGSVTGNASFTYPVGRFTQAPVLSLTVLSASGTAGSSVTYGSPTTSGFTAYVWAGTAASTSSRTVIYTAIQMTSASATG